MSLFVRAALSGDLASSTEIALEFQRERASRATVIADLFDGAQQLITDMWHVGNATSADELRVATAIASAMRALPPALSAPARRNRPRIVLATLSGERHDLGLMLAGMALADDGWDVDVATEMDAVDLVTRATSGSASLVGISVTYPTLWMRTQLPAAVRALHSAGIPVMVGGAAFQRVPGLTESAEVDAVAPDARSGVIIARRLRVAHRRLWNMPADSAAEVRARAS